MQTNPGSNQTNLDTLKIGAVVRLLLKPATDPAWIAADDDGVDVFGDAMGHALDAASLAAVAQRRPIDGEVVGHEGGACIVRRPNGEELALTSAHVEHIELDL